MEAEIKEKIALNDKCAARVEEVTGDIIKILVPTMCVFAAIEGVRISPTTMKRIIKTTLVTLLMEGNIILKETTK